ncbi:CoA transferase subunit A [Marinisporobacter balticus]|uniref:Butyryl-CoA:acetoacetate CoA-transferase alpha subunit n=1 Tax=Marinisporobacter balticus TaxID=2018667 RepID=A0A4R2KW93_9FIRM|nr:3-oxoacid CoA-transferase subunit A [Marinisporobacter balticus]TCO78791.1 butyryl-CoA:acetoacetate CoA-transferase alpha subunit [Marinisporobacter balticus]
MNKIVTLEMAMEHIKDGMTVMIGGFMACGTPEKFMDALVEKGVKDLTVIANDAGFPDRGIGKLVVNKQVKRLVTSHVGLNPEVGKQMNTGEIDCELIPQGTLAERIRAGGNGLGGILTPTGVGTIVEEGKQKIELDGKVYLLEKPLRADIALVGATISDKKGNLYYNKATRNFNPLIATAADLVIIGAEKIVEVGEIDGNDVMTPALFVDYIVEV